MMEIMTRFLLFQPVSSSLKYFMDLLIKYLGCHKKIHPYTYTTQTEVLDIIKQGSTYLTKKLQSNKTFQNFSYHRSAYLTWPYRILFNITTTSNCPPSLLLKCLGILIKVCYPLGKSSWAMVFLKSILWLFKPRIHYKINTILTVDHCTTGEYVLKGSWYSLFFRYYHTK